MRLIRTIGVLALAAGTVAACEDITNPIEEFGTLEDPFVRFQNATTVGTPGSTQAVVVELPTRVEEDVTVDVAFGGDAVFGDDYVIVDSEGDARGDVSAEGATLGIPFDFDQNTMLSSDTLLVFVPFDATDGAVLDIQIQSATTESGRALETGFLEQFQSHEFSIEGFVTAGVATGAYAGTWEGDLGSGDISVTISQPATPVTIQGVEYSFLIDDYAEGAFGAAVPWAFNVTSGGTVIFSPTDAAGFGVTSDIEGSYSFDTDNLTFEVLLTCCDGEDGEAGLSWAYDVTAQ